MPFMKPHLVFIAILILSGVLCEKIFAQATVRRRLVRMGPAGQYFVPNVRVNMYNQLVGFSSPSFSGIDGMYYLTGIPFGSYYLQVWANPANPTVPLSYPVQVFSPVTDIPVIVLP
jgi:hypothetical protein